jgi:hypothetical protein
MGHFRLMLARSPALPHHKVREGAGGTGKGAGHCASAPPRACACAHTYAGISPSLKGRGYSSCEVEEYSIGFSNPRARANTPLASVRGLAKSRGCSNIDVIRARCR